MSDPTLFEREVEEDLRQDRIVHLWRTYGPPTLIGIVIALAASAGYVYYEDRQADAKANASAAYVTALEGLETAATPDAIIQLEGLEKTSGAYGALARMHRANLLSQNAEIDAAVALYERIARDSATDQVLRDLAALKASYLQADREDPDAFATRIERQRRDDNVWLPFVKELAALADLERGYRAGAQTAFAQLSLDPAAPAGLRNRARQLAASLAPPQAQTGLEDLGAPAATEPMDGAEAAPAEGGTVEAVAEPADPALAPGDEADTGDQGASGDEGDDDGA